jgi:molybdate transport system substrate-binding protein
VTIRGAAACAFAAAFGGASCSRHSDATSGKPLLVAAASDLSFAFDEIGASYEKATGQRVIFSFGSTGLLERQIVEGAPFDVFAAADVSFVDDAVKAGACVASSRQLYAVGRLALVAASRAPLQAERIVDLADPRITRVAIANPQHAPYGRAAQQALERAGIWRVVEPKVVYGENVHQALEFAQSGNADAALVALSLTIGHRDHATLIPPELHDPIAQALVVCSRSVTAARAAEKFCAYVTSPAGQAMLQKHGFSAPRPSMPDRNRGSTGP